MLQEDLSASGISNSTDKTSAGNAQKNDETVERNQKNNQREKQFVFILLAMTVRGSLMLCSSLMLQPGCKRSMLSMIASRYKDGIEVVLDEKIVGTTPGKSLRYVLGA
eukprot:306915-Hanusia_phi.AAC.4